MLKLGVMCGSFFNPRTGKPLQVWGLMNIEDERSIKTCGWHKIAVFSHGRTGRRNYGREVDRWRLHIEFSLKFPKPNSIQYP